jgi:hypothetical protein
MPGPQSAKPRQSGPRPDPNGNARKPNAKAAKRLAARQAAFSPSNDKFRAGYHMPGSQKK